MKKFVLYNYEFGKIHTPRNLSFFDNNEEYCDPEESFKKKLDIFEQILKEDYEQTRRNNKNIDKTKLIEFRTLSKQKLCIHTHIIKPMDNIFILKICNSKKITHHTLDFTEEQIEDYPGCIVIIDNREGIQRIAVESNKSVFPGEFTLANILNSTFMTIFKKYNLDFRLTNVQNPRDFWSIVGDTKEYPNGFKKVVFSLPPLNKERVLEKYAELTRIFRKSFNSGMDTSFVSEPDGQLFLSKDDQLQRELVDYSSVAIGGENTIILYPNGVGKSRIFVGKLSHLNFYLDPSVFDRIVKNQKEGDLVGNAGIDKIKIEMKKGYKD